MKTRTTMFLFLFSFLLIDFSAVSAASTCPDPIDRTQVRKFECIIRTQTGYPGGSDNDVYLMVFDTSGRQTDWYKLHNQNNVEFQAYTNDSFTLVFTQIAPDVHFIEIKEYYDPSWWLANLELYCPDVKIDMRFPSVGYINNRDQQLIPSPQTLCPERGTISNGTVTCSDDTKWGSVCHYKCDPVLVQMNGPECVYCQQDGTWSAPVNSTTCDEIGCHSRSLTNGKVSCTDGLNYDSTCTYACNEGFVLRGNSNDATCLLSGHWSDDLPNCEEISCPSRVLTNGKVSCTNDLFFYSTCTYACDEGFALNGSTSATCLLTGDWNAGLPSCQLIGCPPRNLTNGRVSCTNGLVHDSTCMYACNEGFALMGSTSATCMLSGHWSADLPNCEAIGCPQRSLTNGKASCTNGLYFESTCTYECDEGFELRDSNSATCLVSGHWSTNLPSCEAVMCPGQNPLTNGKVQCTDGAWFDSVCTYTCNEGFTLIGSRLSTCKTNRGWHPKPPICAAVVHPDEQKGLGGGAIAGIAVGIVAFFVITGIVAWKYKSLMTMRTRAVLSRRED